ncbi:nitroreductase family protein [Wukongibacter sp. M2B1]|uniref:nitroreductase family protein n=1 Tax=Wukongibacter sp. M2B1 TaxID=3088895 RepID=UPI003D78D84D
MIKDFYTAIENRRSIYGISKETTVSDERIQEVIEDAVKYTPSAFNSQNGRVVVLFGEDHDRLWDITKESLRKIVPEDKFAATEEKINSFRNGYGTVLFFEDMSTVQALQEKFAAYKDNFPIWSQQSSGMLQFIVWTSLEIEGLGASLQHYNELIEDEIKKQWNVPNNWRISAQMPFGKPIAPAGDKEFMPIEERIKIFK